jgi:hypothetical protein
MAWFNCSFDYSFTVFLDAPTNAQRTVIAAKRPMDDRPNFDPNRLGKDL